MTGLAATAKFANDSWLVTRWTSDYLPFASTRKRPALDFRKHRATVGFQPMADA